MASSHAELRPDQALADRDRIERAETDLVRNALVPGSFRERIRRLMVALYVPNILQGLAKTLEVMFRKKVTLQYPEERHIPRKGYRGEHRLKKDAQGRPNCVACYMCATACPANCITIEAMEAPWPDRDKVPKQFTIDLLKCIYCGMCEEACPCDAIELTTTFTQVSTSREEKIHKIDRLLRDA
jgi:NADH-quinone oxidoreductase subunit I